MASRNQNKRQEAKQRSRLFKDLYFLIQWLDDCEEPLYDAIPARDITPPEGIDVLSLLPGEDCQACFAHKLYRARVVAVGKYTEIKREQLQREKDAEKDALENNDGLREDTSSVQKHKDIGREDSRIEMTNNADDKRELEDKEGSQSKEDGGELKQTGEAGKAEKEGQSKMDKGGMVTASKDSEGKATEESDRSKESGVVIETTVGALSKDKTKKGKGVKSEVKKTEKSGCSKDTSEKSSRYEENSAPKKSDGGQSKKRSVERDTGTSKAHGTPLKRQRAPQKKACLARKSPRKKLLTSYAISESDSEQSEEDCINPKKQKTEQSCTSDSEEESLSRAQQRHSSLEARRITNITENELFKKMIGLSTGMSSTTITTEVTKLKEKLRVLEKAHTNLKRKVAEQGIELNHLRRLTSSADISSASEATPESFYSFLPPHGPRHARRSPFSPVSKVTKCEDMPQRSLTTQGGSSFSPTLGETKHETPGFLQDVDPVKLANAKLQTEPGCAALKLMDCVFTTAEMVNGNPSGITRSRDAVRQKTIKALDPMKMKYIDDILHQKWGVTTADKTIRKKMTQKCTDYFTDSRYKHLRLTCTE